MPRHANLEPSSRITLVLPREVKEKLDKHLHNQSLGKIPVGAYQNFFVARIMEYLTRVGG